MAEIGSVGAGMALESAGGATVSVDELGSLLCTGVIGAVSAGGTTGSELAGAVSAGAGAGAGAGSAAGAGAGAGSAAGVGAN